ncbi:MAG: methionine adenosyltransferase [Spirochaetes bacterium]|uniref:S-adenosylmethionine synthase n=1 Tax=Candidatus Ornithospirochaeta stercoripullorum TaxID=2840899 RepID=A0A9D9H5Q2_9SPIO|nr:methionine adenosyltransferase [Candidatus Ornithospirochaeta stercoripullorum]
MKRLFTSESVTDGHPDKVCDQIADGILDALLSQDPLSRSACEVTAEPGAVHIMGEITTKADIDYKEIAKDVIRSIGYTKSEYGFDDSADITCSLHKQSSDIAMGVDSAYGDSSTIGAGDQGMMFGYASDEAEECMPLALALSRKLTMALSRERRAGTLPFLRPDGKSQITVEYDGRKAVRIAAVVLSAQHDEDIALEDLRKELMEKIIMAELPEELLDKNTKFFINPTGRFVLGGPAADTGLTGRKIIADTYGGYAHHGGGAFSGKDPTKVDRTASLALRNIAKTIVYSGAAAECELQAAYAIGVAEPVSLAVFTYGTGRVSDEEILKWVGRHYDLRPEGMIRQLDLRRPIYRKTSSFGAFGRTDVSLPWESINEEALNDLKKLI